MQVLQENGRELLAKALMALPVHVAWGRGDGAWNAAPATPSEQLVLVDEIGRRLASEVSYVIPATEVDSEIEMPGGQHYKRSAEPSPFLYVRATFSFEEAQGETVRECGVFFGTVAKAEVPAGQRYLTPGQLADAGELYSLEYRTPVLRSGTVKGHEEIVIPL
ncbi:hypothetical protein [Diaphorobacter caeni]|uniref:hypothetical protein n=1 Tax=Diaphorobacter caeni TaxID=2784387 RepID=UPI00188E06C5|nr:hypothetical protein [Diaphorobacter caeni]MBF5003368.1 hypothetical protein [Diaphorobacter caeni]